ncbi:CynX/NimT family MFS transporter [Ectopseudomonas guguanensis]|uniref:MFS transporter n=1 Tax=Ectopseudomonas guguanensis TaxID=1198456 RepID=UPI0012D62BEE|nr:MULTISPECIES: MFS transporter [Pseudomonas]MPT21384.1 MFS transporter [Pseudomonas sp.]WJH55844.1 MFS transporter [Pseudomonas guguanensis]
MKPVPRALLLVALVLAAINLRPGITSLAPLIERIAAELTLSRSFISLTTALPVLCMGLLAPLAPRLAMRWGLERTIVLCLGLIGLALLARLAAHQSAVLIGSAIALGAAIAVAGPLLSGFIKRHFASQMGRVVGWYSLGMAIGGAGGAVFTAPVTALFGDAWHLGLAIWAMPALLGVLLWLWLPNQAAAAERQESGGLPWRQPRAWLISCFFAIQAGLFYAIATWVVARYHEAGLSMLRSNSLLSLAMLMGLPSSFLLPWLAQRYNARYPLLLACGAVTCSCLAMVTFMPRFVPELWAVIMGFSLGGSFALSLVLPLYEAGSPLAVSRWTAMMLFTGYSLGCLTPILTGLARDLSGSYRLPFAVLTALALVMTLVAWLLGRNRRLRR